MQGKMGKALKKRASKLPYTSTKQMVLPGFESPFEQRLDATNRWVVLSKKIPWDTLAGIYNLALGNQATGAPGLNPRVALGAIIIKHICGLDDREVVLQIQENMYMQYFLGLGSYTPEPLFDPSLFVHLRKRLGANEINKISERVAGLYQGGAVGREPPPPPLVQSAPPAPAPAPSVAGQQDSGAPGTAHKGKMIIDATACPQDIRYPTDLDLLNDVREKTEGLVDLLYDPVSGGAKPRTYREVAHKVYLKTAQKKQKSRKEIRRALKRQLNYIKRNFKHIDKLLAKLEKDKKPIPLDKHQYKYLLVCRHTYQQQSGMYNEKTHQAPNRVVSIHQPHVRPIVRGETAAKVEFGAKVHVSHMNGFVFLEDFSWEAYNEGTRLMDAVGRYKKRFGYYPADVLADKIYCTRANRAQLKLLGIRLRAKPLGRPKAVAEHVSRGSGTQSRVFSGRQSRLMAWTA